jgi:transposase-like protein
VGQVLHGSATTTHAVRAAIQRSKASIQALSERYGINPKTVAKWRTRTSLEDRPIGPTAPHSTVLSAAEETLIVEFRRHTLLPLDDCLYALQATIPHLTRSALHRLLQRHSISRLPNAGGTRPRGRHLAEVCDESILRATRSGYPAAIDEPARPVGASQDWALAPATLTVTNARFESSALRYVREEA